MGYGRTTTGKWYRDDGAAAKFNFGKSAVGAGYEIAPPTSGIGKASRHRDDGAVLHWIYGAKQEYYVYIRSCPLCFYRLKSGYAGNGGADDMTFVIDNA